MKTASGVSPGIAITSTGTAAFGPIPRDSEGGKPRVVRVTTSAPAYVDLTSSTAPATPGDTLVLPGDGVMLKAAGMRSVSVLSLSGSATVVVTAEERGSWTNDADLDLNLLAESLDPRIAFTRASAGTRFNSAGLMETMTDNAPRFDYDPATPVGVTGPDLVTNGAFAAGSTGWAVGGEWTISGDTASVVGVGSFTNLQQAGTVEIGKTYRITFDVLAISGGALRVSVGGAALNTTTTTVGSKSLDIVAVSASSWLVRMQVAAGVTVTIDNISVREATMSPRGLLIEEQRTNLILQSVALTTSPWSVNGAPTPVAALGLDGALTATTLTSSGVAAGYFQFTAVTLGNSYTFSRYVRKVSGTGTLVRVGTDTTLFAAATTSMADFNLDTLVFSGVSTGATTGYQSVGAGWYRIWVTSNCTTSGSAANLNYVVSTGSVTTWGAQAELGAFPTSYIPTTTAAATRAADSAVMTGANFSSWYNQTEGTMVAAFTRFGFDGTAGSVALVQADDTTSNNRVALRITPRAALAGQQGTIVVAGAVLANDSASVADISSGTQTYGMAYQVNNSATTRNGLTPSATTPPASLPTVTQFQIGQGPGATIINGHIRSVKYFNTRLPNAQLQALTS